MSTLQTRLQVSVVERLEEQLVEEKNRLAAMMDHLHTKTQETFMFDHPNTKNVIKEPDRLPKLDLVPPRSPEMSQSRPSKTYASLIREVNNIIIVKDNCKDSQRLLRVTLNVTYIPNSLGIRNKREWKAY